MLWTQRLTERVQFFRELATLVDSGMSLGMALSTLEQRPGSVELQAAIREASFKVSRGKPFSEVMQDHPLVFSELNVALISAGETGGHLDTMLKESADYLEKDLEFQQTVSRETFYPKILIAAVVLIPMAIPVVIMAVMGSMAAAFALAFRQLLMLSIFVGGPIVAVYYIYKHYQKSEQGRLATDMFKLRIPLIGPVIMRLAWARLSRALAALYGAGVNIRRAVEVSSRTAGNWVIRDMMLRTIPALERGEKLSDALAKTGQVPPLAMSMLRTGEQTGGIDVTMVKVADYFEAEATSSMRKMTTAIVPIAIILVGIVVMIILAQMYGGYFTGLLEQ